MRSRIETISWSVIEPHLTKEKNQKWLGDQLRAKKNVVSNWTRRGIPLAYAREISDLLSIPLAHLLGRDGENEGAIKGQKTALSDEATELILCVVRLESLDESFTELFRHHAALLQLVELKASVQHAPADLNAADIQRLLETRSELTGPNEHEQRQQQT